MNTMIYIYIYLCLCVMHTMMYVCVHRQKRVLPVGGEEEREDSERETRRPVGDQWEKATWQCSCQWRSKSDSNVAAAGCSLARESMIWLTLATRSSLGEIMSFGKPGTKVRACDMRDLLLLIVPTLSGFLDNELKKWIKENPQPPSPPPKQIKITAQAKKRQRQDGYSDYDTDTEQGGEWYLEMEPATDCLSAPSQRFLR